MDDGVRDDACRGSAMRGAPARREDGVVLLLTPVVRAARGAARRRSFVEGIAGDRQGDPSLDPELLVDLRPRSPVPLAALEDRGPLDSASHHAPSVEDHLEAGVGEEHPSDSGVEVRTVPGDDDEERNQYQPRAHRASYPIVVDLLLRRQRSPGRPGRRRAGARVCARRAGADALARVAGLVLLSVRGARRPRAVEFVSKPCPARRPGVSAAVGHPPTPVHSGVTRTV